MSLQLYNTFCPPYLFTSFSIYLPLFDINAKDLFYIYIVMPKWDRTSECTFNMSAKVLSQFSYKTLHLCSAIFTSTDNSIMWSAMEKLLSWMRFFACVICFCSASMLGRIIFYISTNVDMILASSLSNFSCISVKNLIFLKWAELELGSS